MNCIIHNHCGFYTCVVPYVAIPAHGCITDDYPYEQYKDCNRTKPYGTPRIAHAGSIVKGDGSNFLETNTAAKAI